MDKDVADQYRKNDLKVLLGQDISVEEEVNSPKGKLVQLSQKCPLRDERGEIVGIIGNTIDITYLKKIELELKVAKEEAEKANRLNLSCHFPITLIILQHRSSDKSACGSFKSSC